MSKMFIIVSGERCSPYDNVFYKIYESFNTEAVNYDFGVPVRKFKNIIDANAILEEINRNCSGTLRYINNAVKDKRLVKEFSKTHQLTILNWSYLKEDFVKNVFLTMTRTSIDMRVISPLGYFDLEKIERFKSGGNGNIVLNILLEKITPPGMTLSRNTVVDIISEISTSDTVMVPSTVGTKMGFLKTLVNAAYRYYDLKVLVYPVQESGEDSR